MAIRRIMVLGEDDALRKRARRVDKFDKRLRTLLDDMADTMYKADGVGLAAPQVGVLKRAVVIDVGEGLIELVNPEIVASEGAVVGRRAACPCPAARHRRAARARDRGRRTATGAPCSSRRKGCSRWRCATRSTISTACSMWTR